MNLLETPGGIGRSITYRVGALAEMQARLARQEELDKLLREALIAAVPASLRDVVSDRIIDLLFKYGRADDKIYFGKNSVKDFAGVRAKLELLAKAWEGTVRIDISEPETHRVEVWFIAVL